MLPFRIVRPFVAILRAERYPYTSQPLKRGVGPRVGEQATQVPDNGKICRAVISKGYPAGAEGWPKRGPRASPAEGGSRGERRSGGMSELAAQRDGSEG